MKTGGILVVELRNLGVAFPGEAFQVGASLGAFLGVAPYPAVPYREAPFLAVPFLGVAVPPCLVVHN